MLKDTETILDLTHKSRKLALDLKPKSQKCWVNTTEPDTTIPYTDGVLSSQFRMDHGFNLRIIEHSTTIQPDKRGSLN